MEVIFSRDEIRGAAREFWKQVNGRNVVAFHGQIGSGKTTFIHALCEEKEVRDIVGSPTFSIIREYESTIGTIFHIDLFRLNNQEEAVQAGVEECLYSGKLCLVEWPEIAASIFPENTMHVFMEVMGEAIRRIRIDDN